jgi:GH15 family glucan-1,4-alpha-glucosidase
VRPIADYALLGDCHSAALVARDGSIDWACFPRFDSPALFCRILDVERGGTFGVSAEGTLSAERAYLEESNVLATRFETPTGRLELTDCMPVEPFDPQRPARVATRHALLRRVRCLEGEVTAQVVIAPRFEYGALVPRFRAVSAGSAEIVGGADAVSVRATRRLEVADTRVRARWRLHEGEPREFQLRLQDTLAFWRDWMRACKTVGEPQWLVRRSALVLKALTYAPTGAVVAAPTTSLPERIGGARNWDYRYTWIRDATLTLTSLTVLGFLAEAGAFKGFIERTGAGRPEDLQIMYGIKGRRSLPELDLAHLSGHRGSAPVRIGNAAARQRQLDSYGQLLEAAWLYQGLGGELTPGNWRVLAGYADVVSQRWRDPDHGIWEIRDEPRHFLHSKLHCWMALDRAVRLAKARRVSGPVSRWGRERDAVRRSILDDANGRGWFSQALGGDVPDASALVVPALGFLPARDPRFLETLSVVTVELGDGRLVHRYRAPDGLEGEEGAFLLCSFWLLDALAHAGRIAEAEAVQERMLGLANDVGLYAEEADPASGEALGNFPQAFTHMALVTSCAHLEAAREGALPRDGSYGFAAFLLERARAARR